MKNYKNDYINIFVTSICIIILIILILLIVNKYLTSFPKNIENFSNINVGINFQTGTSGISPTGTITFTTPFINPPSIFTQIIGSSTSASNAYSIQILNVKNTGFDYVKNMVYNDTSNNYNITKVGNSTLESFNWIAFG